MKSFLIFISGMFAGAFFLILFLFLYNATNPNYHDCMMDWGNLPDHGCENRWDAPKEIKDSNKIDSNDWDVDVLDDSISVSIDGNISAGDKYRVLLSSKADNPCEVATQVTSFYSVASNSEKKFNNLPSNFVLAQVKKGTKQEKFLMEIVNAVDFIGGKRTLFTVSVNEANQILDFHQGNQAIEIELLSFYDTKKQQKIDKKITDYFDVPKNSWNLIGLEDALLNAKSRCFNLIK